MEQQIGQKLQNEGYYQLIHLYKLKDDLEQEDKIYQSKVKEILEKYKTLGQQIFQNQQDIISGRRKEFQFSKEETADLDKYFNITNHNDQRAKNERFASNEILPISNYWFMAFKNFDLVKPYIRDKDDQILKHLHNIFANISDKSTIELKFEFKENEYFQNQYLVKVFFLNDSLEPERSEGTQIEWYEGKDVCRKTVKKSQKNRKTGAIRVITHEVEDESFFNFFNSLNLEEIKLIGQKKENSLIQQNKCIDRMNIDYDIARAIIDELLPYSLEYYLDVRRLKSKQSEIQDLSFLKEINESAINSSGSEDDDNQKNDNSPIKQSQNNKGKKDVKDTQKEKSAIQDNTNECKQY
ncbi:hypothetical protein ABPG72_000735 [Tetrahymena utriculariae]